MAIVETAAGLSVPTPSWAGPGRPGGSLRFYGGRVQDYAALYRAQPNVRLVVRFIARNVAQLPLRGFRRLEDDRREPLPPEHPLAQLLSSPFSLASKPPSRHRFVRTMVEDLAIFDRYYALKVRSTSGRLNLVRVPPQQMTTEGTSLAGPTTYRLEVPGQDARIFDAADVFHVFGHDPSNPADGVSSLEALRRILAEDVAAGDYREQFWLNAARIPGVLKRPLEAPKWGDPARARFAEDWRATWAGSGTEAGGTPILEEGMEFESTGFSAKESEYLGARRLTREEVAAAYFIPPAFVGISESATFASLREYRTSLYADTLGPWLDWITQELEAQVLPELDDSGLCYVDFGVEAKLAGSFEEQAASMSTATGAPWLLRDEARAKLNLPALPDGQGQTIVTPLNVLVGGLASPRDTAPPLEPGTASRSGAKARSARLRSWETQHEAILRSFFESQRSAVLGRMGAGSPIETAFDLDHWNEVLSDRLLSVGFSMAEDLGGEVAEELGGSFDAARVRPWVEENARITAAAVNEGTLVSLREALGIRRHAARPGSKALESLLEELDGVDLLDDDTPEDDSDPWPRLVDVFALAVAVRAAQIAAGRVTSLGQWARREGASQAGARTKTWVVNASPSRHAGLDGETVPLSEDFSNGAAWPGDPRLDASENAGCLCSLDFGT